MSSGPASPSDWSSVPIAVRLQIALDTVHDVTGPAASKTYHGAASARLSWRRRDVLAPLRGTPRLRGTTLRLRAVVPDVARERCTLAAFTGLPEKLDEGPALLARLNDATLTVAAATERRRRATVEEDGARAALATVFRALDHDVERVIALTGRRPPGEQRGIVRAEARRRDEVGRRAAGARAATAASEDPDGADA